MVKYGNSLILWNRLYTLGVMKNKTDKEIKEFTLLIRRLIPEGLEGFKLIDNINYDREN
jgi:hypothetical protein